MRKTVVFSIMAVGAGLLLSACTLIDSNDKHYSMKGMRLSQIDRAEALLFYNGRLIVANRGEGSGIAVVDTGTGKITSFYAHDIPPYSMALDTLGRLFVGRTTYEKHSIGWIDLAAGKAHGSDIAAHNFSTFISSGGYTYLLDTDFPGPYVLRRVTVEAGGGMTLSAPATYDRYVPTGLLVASGKLFATLSQAHFLWTLDPENPGAGVGDSIDLSPPSKPLNPYRTYAYGMQAHGGLVFVVVNGRQADTSVHSDTNYVAVISPVSKTVVKIIPLHFKNAVGTGDYKGIWYVCGMGQAWNPVNGNPVLDGGVEAIDLNAQTNTGVIVTEETLGGNVGRFMPVSDGAGYAIVRSGDESIVGKVKKVLF